MLLVRNKNLCNSIAMNLALVKKMMTSQALTKDLFFPPFPVFLLLSLWEKTVLFLPFHRQLDVILQTNFSIIIAHCFVVIYSEGAYWTEPWQMMKLTASVNAKLFGNCNYSHDTSNDCVQHNLLLNVTQRTHKKKALKTCLVTLWNYYNIH